MKNFSKNKTDMYFNKSNIFYCVSILPFLWMASGMILFKEGESYMAPLCLLVMIFNLIVYKSYQQISNKLHNGFLLICVLLVAYGIFSYTYHGYGSRELRSLFFLTLYLWFFPNRNINANLVVTIVALGSLSSSAFAIYQHYILGLTRIGGYINSNVIASYISIFCILCFSLIIFNSDKRYKLVFTILFALTLISLLMTLTRGVFLSLVFSVIFLVFLSITAYSGNRKKILFMSLLLMAGLIFLFYPKLEPRIDDTLREYSNIQQGSMNSSFGYRLQLWRASFDSVGKSPIIGLGDHYEKEFELYLEKNLISESLYNAKHVLSHYHNQYLDKLIKNGSIGLILLLVLVFYPILKVLKSNTVPLYRYSLCGLCSLIFLSGITEVPLNHSYIIFVYILIVYLLLEIAKKESINEH
jgi:O-antigen ligase